MSNTERAVVRVLIKHNTTMREKILEWDIIEVLKSMGFRKGCAFMGMDMELVHTVYECSCSLIGPLCIREALSVLGSVPAGKLVNKIHSNIEAGPGDKGKDIICQITGITIVIQCKNYTR
ncbi:21060_t:CDS:2 [Cetraspora pellucida]|uniref:21060_t:CDS:1 n=1 Tax=Cetraspora pellucida TaxID=1433469 RepID=A0A9N8WE81_9GLOM|nr:21060_t:CDS:2 [Cetraspora pellucida]